MGTINNRFLLDIEWEANQLEGRTAAMSGFANVDITNIQGKPESGEGKHDRDVAHVAGVLGWLLFVLLVILLLMLNNDLIILKHGPTFSILLTFPFDPLPSFRGCGSS